MAPSAKMRALLARPSSPLTPSEGEGSSDDVPLAVAAQKTRPAAKSTTAKAKAKAAARTATRLGDDEVCKAMFVLKFDSTRHAHAQCDAAQRGTQYVSDAHTQPHTHSRACRACIRPVRRELAVSSWIKHRTTKDLRQHRDRVYHVCKAPAPLTFWMSAP
jgi:hypothetical protein